jgi:hypothetical protein
MILVRNRSVVVPTGGGFQYDVSADGQHILALAPPEKAGPSEPRTLVPLRYSQINTFGRLLSNWRVGLRTSRLPISSGSFPCCPRR